MKEGYPEKMLIGDELDDLHRRNVKNSRLTLEKLPSFCHNEHASKLINSESDNGFRIFRPLLWHEVLCDVTVGTFLLYA